MPRHCSTGKQPSTAAHTVAPPHSKPLENYLISTLNLISKPLNRQLAHLGVPLFVKMSALAAPSVFPLAL